MKEKTSGLVSYLSLFLVVLSMVLGGFVWANSSFVSKGEFYGLRDDLREIRTVVRQILAEVK